MRGPRRDLIPTSSQTAIICHSERSEESPFFKPPRFFTPLRSVQNDIDIYCLLTATSYQRGSKRVQAEKVRSQAGRAVAQIGLGLVFSMAKIVLRSGKVN